MRPASVRPPLPEAFRATRRLPATRPAGSCSPFVRATEPTLRVVEPMRGGRLRPAAATPRPAASLALPIRRTAARRRQVHAFDAPALSPAAPPSPCALMNSLVPSAPPFRPDSLGLTIPGSPKQFAGGCQADSPECGRRWHGGSASKVSAPEGIRTPNLLIRSQMLYPLSYGRLVQLYSVPRRDLAEARGFEPPVPFEGDNSLAVSPIRPLWHASLNFLRVPEPFPVSPNRP